MADDRDPQDPAPAKVAHVPVTDELAADLAAGMGGILSPNPGAGLSMVEAGEALRRLATAGQPVNVARQEGKRALLDGITNVSAAHWPDPVPPPSREEFAESVRDAVRKVAALPPPPKCVAMNPSDIEALRGRHGTLGPDGYELRDEYPKRDRTDHA